MPAPRFTPKTLSFLRALKRHNDREWFKVRREEYEQHVRGPMIAVIERLAEDFKRKVGALEGEKLSRVPPGFPKDHPAAECLKFRQFLAGHEYPATCATSPRFYPTLVALFRDIAPLCAFLNEPLLRVPKDPLVSAFGP